jgi:hypothetical protein
MAKDRSLVRASDLSAWAYCNRAWWLANVKGAPHQHPQQLAQGIAAHRAHGAGVRRATLLRRVGLALIALAALLMIAGGLWLLM